MYTLTHLVDPPRAARASIVARQVSDTTPPASVRCLRACVCVVSSITSHDKTPSRQMDGDEVSKKGKLGERLSLAVAMERNAAFTPDQGLAKIQATVRARVAREKFLASKESAVRIQSGVRGLNTRRFLTTVMTARKAKSASLSIFAAQPVKKSAFAMSSLDLEVNLDNVTQSLAQAKLANARKGPNTERLHGAAGTRVGRAQHTTYAATRDVDRKRKRLLLDARRISPMDTVLRVDKYGQTILIALLKHPVTWIVIATYAGTAALCRNGYIHVDDLSLVSDAFESGGIASFITFMVVFYVGYCCACSQQYLSHATACLVPSLSV